jgi:hypothetical protein
MDMAQALDPRAINDVPFGNLVLTDRFGREANVAVDGIVAEIFAVISSHLLELCGPPSHSSSEGSENDGLHAQLYWFAHFLV